MSSSKIGTGYFEQIIDGDSQMWDEARQSFKTQTVCLAAIVVLLSEIQHELSELNKAE